MNSITSTIPEYSVPSSVGANDLIAEEKSFAGYCLVVSASGANRAALRDAAAANGWQVVVCSDAGNAHAEAERTGIQLAVVDLPTEESSAAYRWLCERLVADHEGVLLLICGHENDPCEESWARQLGAWIYVPGLSSPHFHGSLFEQAREIACRLAIHRLDIEKLGNSSGDPGAVAGPTCNLDTHRSEKRKHQILNRKGDPTMTRTDCDELGSLYPRYEEMDKFVRIRRPQNGIMPVGAYRAKVNSSHKTDGSRRASRRISRLEGGMHHRRQKRIEPTNNRS